MVWIILFLIGLVAFGLVVSRLPHAGSEASHRWYDPDVHALLERISDWLQNLLRDALRSLLVWVLHMYQRVGARVQLTGRIKKILRTHLYEHNRDGMKQKSAFLRHMSAKPPTQE